MYRALKSAARNFLWQIKLNNVQALDLYKTLKSILRQDQDLKSLDILPALIQLSVHTLLQQQSLSAVFTEIANFLLNSGQPEIAQKYYQKSLALEPNALTHSLYLQCLLLSPSCTDQQMHQEALKYSSFLPKLSQSALKIVPKNLDPKKKLTVGYISHFFHNSVSQSLLVPILLGHNRSDVQIICYSDAPREEVSDEIRKIADLWRDTKDLDDISFAQLIRHDEVDILLETNGHCAANRYLALADKPAPIQISYYNLAATSGVAPIDYIITGSETTIDPTYYTESIYYLPGVSGIAQFPDHFPECAPPPCLKNRFITFGSFGAAHKVNTEVVKLWCQVLKAVPNSCFYMKAGVLSHPQYKNAYQKLFAENGIDLKRVRLEGYSEHQEMLKCYADVDIALDTFPHAAGTTTMEALWQGVPVITLSGTRQCMQNGKIILSSIGHNELITYCSEDYINKAMELAKNHMQLITYRKQLRNDFKCSPRADVATYVQNLEQAFRTMWQTYCKTVMPS